MTDLPSGLEGRKVFRWRDLAEAGMTRRQSARALSDGALEHPTFGSNGPERRLWVVPDAIYDPELPEVAACLLTGGTICGTYAAARHGLVDDLHGRIQVVVPMAANPDPRPWLAVRRTQSHAVLSEGVVDLPTDLGVPIRITGRARTTVDMVRLRGRDGEGLRHGIDALRAYLSSGGDPGELLDVAASFEDWVVPAIKTAAEAFGNGGPAP